LFEIVSIYSSIKQITNGTNKLINYFCRYGILFKTHRKAVNEMSQLPGIGKRTALRLVLHLLKQPKEQTGFIASLSCVEDIKYCNSCHNISDSERCEICANQSRNHQIICIVEDIRDVMAKTPDSLEGFIMF
jgi:recombination protein RecR